MSKSAKRVTEAHMNQRLVCINIVFWFVREINTVVIWKKNTEEYLKSFKQFLDSVEDAWRATSIFLHLWLVSVIQILLTSVKTVPLFLSVFILALSFSDNSSSWDSYQSGESLHFSTTIVIRNLFYWAMWDDTSSYYLLDVFQHFILLCVSEPVPSSSSSFFRWTCLLQRHGRPCHHHTSDDPQRCKWKNRQSSSTEIISLHQPLHFTLEITFSPTD